MRFCLRINKTEHRASLPKRLAARSFMYVSFLTMLICKGAQVRSKVKKEHSVTNNCHPQLRKNGNVLRLPLTAHLYNSGEQSCSRMYFNNNSNKFGDPYVIAVTDSISEQLPPPSAVTTESLHCPVCRLQRPIHNP